MTARTGFLKGFQVALHLHAALADGSHLAERHHASWMRLMRRSLSRIPIETHAARDAPYTPSQSQVRCSAQHTCYGSGRCII